MPKTLKKIFGTLLDLPLLAPGSVFCQALEVRQPQLLPIPSLKDFQKIPQSSVVVAVKVLSPLNPLIMPGP